MRRILMPKEVDAYCKSVESLIEDATNQGMTDHDSPVPNGPTIAQMQENMRCAKKYGYIEA